MHNSITYQVGAWPKKKKPYQVGVLALSKKEIGVVAFFSVTFIVHLLSLLELTLRT